MYLPADGTREPKDFETTKRQDRSAKKSPCYTSPDREIRNQSVAIGCTAAGGIPRRSEPRAKLQIDISIYLGVRRR
ncbi:unnamed protein product [Lasius platythorax]|uniref:Uncharacterized protein n=1 Tax=Lasius platythorax TaxID=488582 RepID=A0AAV2NG25_9HYME